ncbi:hypothetical protein, partial [Salinispira pacifica]
MHYCSYVHDELLPRRLREELEDALYRALVNPDGEAGEAPVAAGEPAAKAGAGAAGGRERALRYMLSRLVAGARFRELTSQNPQLSERVSHEALHWCANQWALSESGTPPSRERELSERPAPASEALEPDRAAELLELTKPYPEMASIRALFADRAAAARQATPGSSRTGAAEAVEQAVADKLHEQWRAAIDRREERRQLSVLHAALLPYVSDLNRRVPKLHRYFETMRDLFGDGERFWDLSRGRFTDADVGPIEEYSRVLESEPSIRELAEILGRGRGRQDELPEVEEQVMLHLAPYAGTAGKSQITGIRFGNDVGSLLPSELALLSSPETEPLFYRKFAESELLCLAYTTRATYYRTEYR